MTYLGDGRNTLNGTYKLQQVGTGVFLDVLKQVTTWHQFRNELERNEGDAKEGQNVWMSQAFPQDGLAAEGLQYLVSSR